MLVCILTTNHFCFRVQNESIKFEISSNAEHIQQRTSIATETYCLLRRLQKPCVTGMEEVSIPMAITMY